MPSQDAHSGPKGALTHARELYRQGRAREGEALVGEALGPGRRTQASGTSAESSCVSFGARLGDGEGFARGFYGLLAQEAGRPCT